MFTGTPDGILAAMRINILLGNLEPHLWEMNGDNVNFVRYGLEDCGVEVRIGTDQLDPNATNLFFDRFYTAPNFPMQMEAAKIPFGLVCTEAIGPDGTWNYGAEGGGQAYNAFALAAERAEFIWCVLEESVEACRALNERVAHIPYGYTKRMETVSPIPVAERDIDFLLCGFTSPRRREIMDGLAERGYRTVHPGGPIPAFLRDALMACTRINLSVQKTDQHGIISPTRICHSVINKIPVLLEADEANRGGEDEYSQFCLLSGAGDLAKACAELIEETDLAAHVEEAYERMRLERPLKEAMAGVLEATLGGG